MSAVYVSMFMPIGWYCYQFWSEKLLSSWAAELQTENYSKSKNDDFECSAKNGTPVSSCRRYREHCGGGAGKKVRTEGGTEYYGTLSYRHELIAEVTCTRLGLSISCNEGSRDLTRLYPPLMIYRQLIRTEVHEAPSFLEDT